MFVIMSMAGLKKTVSEWQVRALEAMGWKQVPGAKGVDAVVEDAPPQTSPKTRKPRAKKNV